MYDTPCSMSCGIFCRLWEALNNGISGFCTNEGDEVGVALYRFRSYWSSYLICRMRVIIQCGRCGLCSGVALVVVSRVDIQGMLFGERVL